MSLLASPQDIVLGTLASPNLLPGSAAFRLSPADQRSHALVIGRTGTGKSQLGLTIAVQHLNKGHGVGVIEPHHDLSFDLLRYLVSHGYFDTDEGFRRLVYIDWGNGAYVPFNILAGDGDPHSRARNALESWLRVWPELGEAPLFQTLFLSGVVTLIENRLPITFLHRLLVDPSFRHACLTRVGDRLVHQTFEHFEQLGRGQAHAAGSTLRRAYLQAFHPSTRYTLGAPDNVLRFRQWMDEGTSFILNLGNVDDPETRRLIGAALLVQIEQAALSRKDLPPDRRRPFTLLLDEWPAFAAQERTLATILEQLRKFNLQVYLTGQSLAQIPTERLAGAFENVRLTVAFGLGRDSAAKMARQIAIFDPQAIKAPALGASQRPIFLSRTEQLETWTTELQNLPPRIAFVKLHDRPAVKIKTLTVPQPHGEPERLEAVVAAYRHRYQRSRVEAEAAAARLLDRVNPAVSARSTLDPRSLASAAPAWTHLFGAGVGERDGLGVWPPSPEAEELA